MLSNLFSLYLILISTVSAKGNPFGSGGRRLSPFSGPFPNTCNLPPYQFDRNNRLRKTGPLQLLTLTNRDQCTQGWVRAGYAAVCLEPCDPNYVNEGDNCKLDETKCPPAPL